MNRSTLIRFALALAVLLAAGGGYAWWQTRLDAMRASVAEQAQEILDTRAALAHATKEKAMLGELAEDEAAVQSHLVSDASIVSFLNMLESTGRASGADVSIVSVSPQKNGAHPMLTVSAEAEGSFSAVVRTVGAIESVPYYVVVRSLTLSYVKAPGEGDGAHAKGGHWTATFTAAVGAFAQIASTTTP
ncbi:MAG TPA: hypothetical protein VF829_00160 [Candidatus Paceibacterota bacterium]